MGFSLADFDPTSSSAAFGGLVRQGVTAVGGGSYLAQVDAGLARKRAAGSTGAAPPPPPVFDVQLGSTPRWVLYAGAGLAVAVVLYLALRK